MNADQCANKSGTYHGDGTSCAAFPCFATAPPTVVGVSTDQVFNSAGTFVIRVTRVWSDGQIDSTAYEVSACRAREITRQNVIRILDSYARRDMICAFEGPGGI